MANNPQSTTLNGDYHVNGVYTKTATVDNADSTPNDTANGVNDLSAAKIPQPLNVLVVGAGLGGLTSALALRRAGHKVTIFERSRLASEYGAAINVPPNATGILKRLGIDPRDEGAVELQWFTGNNKTGDSCNVHDFAKKNEIWQHKFLLAHRVDLHTQLKNAATSLEGLGTPAKLITGTPVVDVDVHNGIVTLKDGSTEKGDLIVGADGIHSVTRTKITHEKPFHSGKSAYRFVLKRADARKNPETAEVVERDSELVFWFDTDRRIVMYPTRNNEVLNFVCIHPDKNQDTANDTWNTPGSVRQLLEDFEGFDERVRGLLRMADESTLNVWTLTDMNIVPQWYQGRFCLVGDAAHPFLPHQGQGGAQAIEDGVALGVILPLGVTPQEIPSRLELYQECRKERAEYIQQVTRESGEDIRPERTDNAAKVLSFFDYNFGHDEHDSATLKLRNWLYKKQRSVYWRMPTSFGPSSSPRQDFHGVRPKSDHSTFVTRSVEFKTSRTVAQNLLPTSAFSFDTPDTYAYATLLTTTLDNMDWLGGKGYNYAALFLNNVRYQKLDGSFLKGNFCAVMLENLTDPILTGREEVGFPKLFSDIDIEENSFSTTIDVSWRKAKYLTLKFGDFEESTVNPANGSTGILLYKYVPATGQPGIADAEYPVYVPPNPAIKTTRLRSTSECSIDVRVHDRQALPTLHHIVTGLAGLPIYEIVKGSVREGTGPDDMMSAYRIE